MRIFTAPAAVLATALAAPLLLGAALPAAADTRCPVHPRDQWMSVTAMAEKAAALGYAVLGVEPDDGCYEVKARDAGGNRVEVKFDPVSGAAVAIEHDD